MNLKISTLYLVYKVESYLRKCIIFITVTFTDFELILFDDGLPGGCGEIREYYEKRIGRVVVIHKENGGRPLQEIWIIIKIVN